ncbi:hypothetical protein [Kibdelosporangium phytohabitans]|uniref:Uncharacterized protein n=1 Tax=Kibdelosporangium phytohabitans TaxID=860235 RepID=A0A0N9IB31_9PSEU|nr:hypothetical protein [Kibdelosporangium phytohabitans]ALG12016.1 hypothetical protein AOZ06_38700 [Kibdelosporangium phytohabitans]MBE1463488.1 hypothetical protein [Kibdelosporangium phytohabitans]
MGNTDGKTGLEYFLASDAWKQAPQFAEWDKIDVYVEKGWLTERDRDLLHAYGSMAVLSGGEGGGGGFPETDAAWSKYLDVKEKHKNDPLFNRDADGEVKPPDQDKTPEDDGKLGGDHTKHEEYKIKPGEPPPVPGGADGKHGGKDSVSVNTASLKKFGENMLLLRDMVETSRKNLKDVHILPGAFPTAFALRDAVNGAAGTGDKKGGLKGDSESYMTNLEIEFRQIKEAIDKVIREYDTVEKLNGLTADKLTVLMNEPFSYINNNTGKPK